MTYTITAKPATGWIFDHWSGSADNTSARLSFVMQEGFAVTASFRENPFYARKGSYTGLIQAASATHATSGLLKLATTVSGGFSGRLTSGGKAYAVSGKFDETGNAQVTIRARSRSFRSPSTRARSRWRHGSHHRFDHRRHVHRRDLRRPGAACDGRHFAAGRYTVTFPPNPADTGATYPKGTGSAVLVMNKPGAPASMARWPMAAVQRQRVSVQGGILPIYARLMGGEGSLAGRVTLNPASHDAHWHGAMDKSRTTHRPPSSRRLRDSREFAGARYTAPLAGVPALQVPATQNNSALRFTGGDLPAGVTQTHDAPSEQPRFHRESSVAEPRAAHHCRHRPL